MSLRNLIDRSSTSSALPRFFLLASSLCLTIPPLARAQGQDVVTYHNDNARTAQNLNESTLTTANVNSSTFGRLFTLSVDGKVDAQPLVLSALTIPGKGAHNVVFVATENDSMYAFDADTGALLWHVSLLPSGETPATATGMNCNDVSPVLGITATPVIDRGSGPNGTLYAVAMSQDAAKNYHQRLHALDVTTGQEEFSGPVDIVATFPGTGPNSQNGMVVFNPFEYKERAALLLVNHVIYTTWASHCDIPPYNGWVIGYNESTLAQANVLNLTPNGTDGAVWSSGGGPAADSGGNIYLLDGNGTFETTLDASGFPNKADFGNGFLKLAANGSSLTVTDYFNMSNTGQESGGDIDLGSGAAMLLPPLLNSSGVTKNLAVAAGKDTNIYVVDRDNMGKFSSTSNNIYQQLQGVLPGGIWSTPAYFNNTVYYGPVGHPLLAFQLTNALLAATPSSQTSLSFVYPGVSPSISANGSSNGILWALENAHPAVLHAYDATNLAHELYNSNQVPTRDHFGNGNKFGTTTIANGHVFVQAPSAVGVFGLLPPSPNTATSLSSSLNPEAAGATVTFTATVSSTTGTPTGSINFNDGATTVGTGTLNASGIATFATSTLAIGSHSITAVYGGDASHTASTSTVLNQVITGLAATTSLSSSLNPAAVGAAVTFTAKVTSTTGTPTGSVTFRDGATTLGTGVLDATASATLTTSALAAGSHSITAVYSGDSSYATSTSTVLTQVVLGAGASVTATVNPNPSTFGQPVTISASVKSASGLTPTGTVTFTDTTKGFTLGTVTLDANGNRSLTTGATTLRGGTHSITAAYGGDKNYGTSSSTFTQTVNKAPTSTAISSSANPSTSGTPVTFTATVSWPGPEIPAGNVQFKDGATVIATVALATVNGAAVATFTTTTLTVGTHSILAHYRGTASYAVSNSPVLSQTVQ